MGSRIREVRAFLFYQKLWLMISSSLYYRYSTKRLSACRLTIHGLLHISDNIRFCGPVWTTWTFFMERFCGSLKNGLRSKVHPWANLNNRVLQLAYVKLIDHIYGEDNPQLGHALSSPRTVNKVPGCKLYFCCICERTHLHYNR